MEGMHRARYVEGTQSRHALSKRITHSALHVFTNLEALQFPSVRVFLWSLLSRHDWLNAWPLRTNSTSNPSPLPRGWEGEVESSNPLITWLVPGKQPPILTGFSESHLININSGVVERRLLWIMKMLLSPLSLLSLRKYKGFRSSVPGTETKTKYIFPIINRSITQVNHQDLQKWELRVRRI